MKRILVFVLVKHVDIIEQALREKMPNRVWRDMPIPQWQQFEPDVDADLGIVNVVSVDGWEQVDSYNTESELTLTDEGTGELHFVDRPSDPEKRVAAVVYTE